VNFHKYLERHVVATMADPDGNELSEMLASTCAASDPIDLAELVGLMQSLVTAGHETTANWLTMSLFHLLSERERWEQLCSDPSQIPEIVEETLRYETPAFALWRTAAADTTIANVRIRAGDRLYCLLGSSNRDETAFDNADDYEPGRPDGRRHLAFGRGIHTCVGASLARLEGRVAFEVLRERLPSLRSAQSTISFIPNTSLRLTKGLQLEWDI
jgi:cytochrome P450